MSQANLTIDQLYHSFVDQLPADLRLPAGTLPFRLGLTPYRNVPWSQVLNSKVLVELPSLLFGQIRDVAPDLMAACLRAHVFAIIGERARRQIDAEPDRIDLTILRIVEHLRSARDQAMARLTGGDQCPQFSYEWAEERTADALEEEASALASHIPATMAQYRQISTKKQSMAFPASLAMAHALGFSAKQKLLVANAIGSSALALQLRDDAVSWTEVQASQTAWPTAILGDLSVPTMLQEQDYLTYRFHREGVLVHLLQLSSLAFRRSAKAALELGANVVFRWAHHQAELTEELAFFESRTCGYAVQWERRRQHRKTDRIRPLSQQHGETPQGSPVCCPDSLDVSG